MAEAGGFSSLERDVAILRERAEQNRTRIDDVQKRLDGVDQSVRLLLVIPIQQESLKQDVKEIKEALQVLAREQQAREQWLKSFELQAAGLQETRKQNVRSSTYVVIGMAVTIILALITVTAGVLERAVH